MDLRLQFLESFQVAGSDGETYKLRAYDRQASAGEVGGAECWESTGVVEYRLDDGRLVDARPDGSLRIVATGVSLAAPAPR